MTQIGYFTDTADGFAGRLQMLGIDQHIVFQQIDAGDDEHAPDYRLRLGEHGDGPEIGAGWESVGDKAGAYVSVIIDSPLFAEPLRANLFSVNEGLTSHVLVWLRRKPREAKQ